MGRTKPSAGLPPAAFRKDARAKKARATINKVIPTLLAAHPRARQGVALSKLITPDQLPDHADTSRKGDDSGRGPRITLRVTDTLTAAHALLACAKSSSHNHGDKDKDEDGAEADAEAETERSIDLANRRARVAILNMASPLQPGGGFLNGAASQEESLCMRTTLLPSLRDDFYRLPELGAVHTPDVLVFRDAGGDDLPKRDRWFVDCVSAAMLRQPDVTTTETTTAADATYASQKDRELVLRKMRLVMDVFHAKGAKRVVLGAWGCGAYGNPVGEVAGAWRTVLTSSRSGRGASAQKNARAVLWEGIEEVVFAIKDTSLADRFAKAFGDGLLREEANGPVDGISEGEDDPGIGGIRELEEKIREMERNVEQAKSPQLRSGLSRALAGLRDQLRSQQADADQPSGGEAADGESGDEDT